jgi:hypothetical protein
MACESCGAIFGQLALFEGQCASCYGVSNARRGELLLERAYADLTGHERNGGDRSPGGDRHARARDRRTRPGGS